MEHRMHEQLSTKTPIDYWKRCCKKLGLGCNINASKEPRPISLLHRSIPPPFAHGHPIHNHNVILCYVYNVHILTLNTIITLNQSRTIPAIYCILFTHTECKLQPAPMLERNTVLENSAHSPLIWQFVVQVSQGCSLRSSCSGLTLLIKVLLINSNTCPYPMFVYFSVFPASRIFVIDQTTHNI